MVEREVTNAKGLGEDYKTALDDATSEQDNEAVKSEAETAPNLAGKGFKIVSSGMGIKYSEIPRAEKEAPYVGRDLDF